MSCSIFCKLLEGQQDYAGCQHEAKCHVWAALQPNGGVLGCKWECRRLLLAACCIEGLTWNMNLYWPRTTGPTRTLSSSWSYFSDSAEPTYVNFHSKSAGRHSKCASAPCTGLQARRQSGYHLVTTPQRIKLALARVLVRHGSGCQMTSREA